MSGGNKKTSRVRPGRTDGATGLYKADHDPRAAALAALNRVLEQGVDAQAALDAVLASPTLMPTDKRLCTELVYGVLRWHERLRGFAGLFLRQPEKLPAEMRLTLLLALYELAFLRIPPRATVHWAVEHVGNRFGKGLGSVANGTLRSMQRRLKDFADPALYAADVAGAADAAARASGAAAEEDALRACRYAMPLWIVRLWRESYGPQAALQLLEASQRTPPAGLRLNRARPGWEAARETLLREADRDGGANITTPGAEQMRENIRDAAPETVPDSRPDSVKDCTQDSAQDSVRENRSQAGAALERPVAVGPCALAFPGGLPWQVRDLLADGRASRQSAASYEALEHCGPALWPAPVWDCCAGRGGKTLALLEQGVAVALASDVSERRLRALREEYARLKLTSPPCPVLLPQAADTPAPLSGKTPLEQEANQDGNEPCSPVPSGPFGAILVDAPCSGLGTLSRHPEIRLRRTPADLTVLAGLQKDILHSVWRHLLPGGLLVYLTCTVNPAENEEQIARFLAAHPDAVLEREWRTPFASPLCEFFYAALLRNRASEA